MNAPDAARDESRPLDRADHSNRTADAASPSIERPDDPRPLDLAEVMPPVGRVVLGLAQGADLFLNRMRVESPSFVGKPNGDDDWSAWRRYNEADGRLDRQHRDSVEAARLAGVLARLLERYRAGLRDLTEAEATHRPRPGRDA